ncbi:SGNH/GDSL hydrolase family protein [Nocardia yamanashiensis]|uniref:SGNH/GDSL hydrolase family protein n=1 Tax=Nocardia yamanashiensis TaxID=209247 RepID=UPI001E576EB5|nr:SGNH/GDSL hydrolase family protein [Nocardia yamanashiensis]UGT45104.1 SGNH/GDSL hydrolase family protein [Nocardia yamanashiensis]
MTLPWKRTAVRWLCALATAVAAVSLTGTAAGDAATGKTIVVLGDSFTANAWDWFGREQSCIHKATSWPAQLHTLAQPADTLDVSCPGASIDTPPGYTLGKQAQIADQQGAFGPQTRLVALQFGLNDRWGVNELPLLFALQQCVFNLVQGCDTDAVEQGRIPDYNAVTGSLYASRVSNAVTYIKYYAPNARVVLVGYPEFFPPGQTSICLNILGVAPYIQARGAALTEFLDRLDTAQREAAQTLGIEFLDVRALTTGHGLCSAQPWLNGVLDYRTDLDGLPFHPSTVGDAVVANALNARYQR